jgi:DNA-binding transcriptional ArsR family regulator
MLSDMNLEYLNDMEAFYMALADKTRLRLLDLMRDEEVCVGSFTELLGESQPKISRHLAYLRNAGLVQARRDGKWIHYRITWPREGKERRVLTAALEWIASRGDEAADGGSHGTRFSEERYSGDVARTDRDRAASPPETRPRPVDEPTTAAHNDLEEFLL